MTEIVTADDIHDALLGYNDSTVSAAFALQIVAQHDCDPAEFTAELGQAATYSVARLFGWLGY